MKLRNLTKRILILCEDEKSSKLYFESFKHDEKLKRELSAVDIQVVHPKYHDPVGMVRKAKEMKQLAQRQRNAYDEIWIVIDRDTHANFEEAYNTAKANKIKIALSVICFEYWILLHFEKIAKPFNKCKDIITYIKKKHFPDYQKNINCYMILSDKIGTAIINGEWLDKQNKNEIDLGTKIFELSAYTNVHLLVKKLLHSDKYL